MLPIKLAWIEVMQQLKCFRWKRAGGMAEKEHVGAAQSVTILFKMAGLFF